MRHESFPAALRAERGKMSQDELGELIGVAGSTVSMWENGVNHPTQEHYNRLLDVMPCLKDHPRPECEPVKKGKEALEEFLKVSTPLPITPKEIPREKKLEMAGLEYAKALGELADAEKYITQLQSELQAGKLRAERALKRVEMTHRVLLETTGNPNLNLKVNK